MVTVEELAAFLIQHGLAEEKPGYGHATGQDVAQALIMHYDIRPLDERNG